MSTHCRGIVFKAVKYGDSSLIVKIFSKDYGLQTYLIKGAFSRNSKYKSALFQPMTLIEFESRIRPGKDIQYMSEIMVETAYFSIPFDMRKNAIVLYISELLNKAIQEEESNINLYGFIHKSMEWLDLHQGSIADFPVFFTFELSRYLGFYPKPEKNCTTDYFDLLNGMFVQSVPSHPYFTVQPLTNCLLSLYNLPLEQIETLDFSNDTRRQLINILVDYYQLHLPSFKGLKSHEILRSVLE